MGRKKRKRHVSDAVNQNLYHNHGAQWEIDEKQYAVHDEVLEEIFNKKFTYLKLPDTPWVLPESLSCDDKTLPIKQWEIFMNLKRDLNETKGLLSDKDISTWHRHTQQANPSGAVNSQIKKAFDPELCTQAWCKFYEILSKFDLVPKEDTFRSLHLCEAPGAFISCLNHYLKVNRPTTTWEWTANTLNPYYEGSPVSSMIDDDRLLFHTLEHWDFGVDGTGDIMNSENHLSIRNSHKKKDVKLVTADGSIDCQDNPGEQELIVVPLKLWECLLALSILEKGGHFVQKMFTMFEVDSACLLYLLNCCFKEVHVFKPATSKPGNSEVYVVCLEFYGEESIARKYDIDHLNCEAGNPLFSPSSIPHSFIEQHIKCCEMFKNWQTDTIHRNVKLLTASAEEKEILYVQQNVAVTKFIEKCKLQAIAEEDRLVVSKRAFKMARLTSPRPGQRQLAGSYEHRRWQQTVPWKERILMWEEHDFTDTDDSWLESSSDDEMELVVTLGKYVDCIRSSKFCDIKLLQEIKTLQQSECPRSFSLPNLENWTEVKRLLSATFQNKNIVLIDIGAYCDEEREGKLLNIESKFSSHFQSMRLAAPGEVLQLNELPVHFLNFTGEENDTKDKKFSIVQVLSMLKEIKPDGTVLVKLHTTLLRFTVGLLFMLYKLFSKVIIINDTSKTDEAPQRFCLCVGYRDQSETNLQSLVQHLVTVESILADNLRNPLDSLNKDVWEIMAMHNLYGSNFYGYIYQSNNFHLKQEINYLIQQNKLYYNATMTSADISS